MFTLKSLLIHKNWRGTISVCVSLTCDQCLISSGYKLIKEIN